MTEQSRPKARGHIVVAVDGSPAADNVVDWAADEASLRGVDLEVLHAREWKAYEGSERYGYILAGQGSETVQAAAKRARRRRPELGVAPPSRRRSPRRPRASGACSRCTPGRSPDLPVYGVATQPGPTVEAIRTCQQNGEAILSQT